MASRLRKVFSRKKIRQTSPGGEPEGQSHSQPDNPTLGTSLYDTALSAGPPETGSYPIKGDANTPTSANRRPSNRGRKHQPSKSESAMPPAMPPTPDARARPISTHPSTTGTGVRMVDAEPDITNDLSRLRLNDDKSRPHASSTLLNEGMLTDVKIVEIPICLKLHLTHRPRHELANPAKASVRPTCETRSTRTYLQSTVRTEVRREPAMSSPEAH